MTSSLLTETLFESFPAEHLAHFGHEESEDLLDDLGYLAIDQNTNRFVDEATYQAAITAFRADFKSFSKEIDASIQLPTPLPEHQLAQAEIDFLNHITSLDGDFHLPSSLSKIFKNELLKRIWIYRLQLLSFASNHLVADSKTAIEQLQKWLGKNKHSEAAIIRLTGDIPQLTNALVRKQVIAGTGYHHIVYFDHTQQRKPKDFSNNRDHFKDYFKSEIRATAPTIQRFEKTISRKKHIEAYLKDANNAEFNRFMIRLVQIQLWMLGTSNLKLDSDLKGLDPDHIRDTWWLAHQVRNQLQISHLLYFKNQIWMLNVRTLIERFIPTVLNENRKQTASTISEELLNVVDQTKANSANQKKVVQEIQAQLEPESATVSKKKYKGKNKVWGAIKKVFNKVVNTLKDIINLIKNFFHKIKDAVRRVWDEIRETFRLVDDGFKFLFGKRVVQTPLDEDQTAYISTDFDQNFDSVTRFSAPLTTAQLQAHQAACQHQLLAAQTTLVSIKKMLLTVIKVVKIAGPVGWLRLGLMLVKALGKQVIKALV